MNARRKRRYRVSGIVQVEVSAWTAQGAVEEAERRLYKIADVRGRSLSLNLGLEHAEAIGDEQHDRHDGC